MVKLPGIHGLAEVSATILVATWSVRSVPFFLSPVQHYNLFCKGLWTSKENSLFPSCHFWLNWEINVTWSWRFFMYGGFRFCCLFWQIPLFHSSVIFIPLLCEHRGKSFLGIVCHLHHFPLVKTGLGLRSRCGPDSRPVVDLSISFASSWIHYIACQQHYFYWCCLEVIKRYLIISL